MLRPKAGGIQATGLAIATAVPLAALGLLSLALPEFRSWRTPVGYLWLFGAVWLSFLLFRWLKARPDPRRIRLREDELLLQDREDRYHFAREALQLRCVFPELRVAGRQRFQQHFELRGTDHRGDLHELSLNAWRVDSPVEHRGWPTPVLAARLSGWIDHGTLHRPDATMQFARPSAAPADARPSVDRQVPAGLRWAFYLGSLVFPIIAWWWLAENASPGDDAVLGRALGYFWLCFVFFLIIQPVIGRLFQTTAEVLIAIAGPFAALGLAQLFSPATTPSATHPMVMLAVELGSLRFLTVFLAFAVVAWIAPFSTGIYRGWERDDLNYFALRACVALVILIPALFFSHLLAVELWADAGDSAWWYGLAWVGALGSETALVLRRMLREAAL